MAITISGTASATRTNLGLGNAATLDVGTSANNLIQLDSSGNLPAVDGSLLTGVGGGILQCQTASAGSQYSFTSTSASEDTALTVNITPQLSTSKMLVLFYDGIQNQGTNNTFYNRFTRDVSGGSETNISGDIRNETNTGHFGPFSHIFVDEPGTTTALEYKRYFWSQGSTMVLSFNNATRSMIVLEIDA